MSGPPRPWRRESPMAMLRGKLGASARRATPAAFIAATRRRNLAMAAAKGFLSTPWTEPRDRLISSQRSTAGALVSGFPLPAWRDPLRGGLSDGRDAQEVRSGLQGGRGAAGPGDRQADRAGGPGAGHP